MSITIKDLRYKINSAIRNLPKGWKIGLSLWISPKRKLCCPLGALILQIKFEELGKDFDPLNCVDYLKEFNITQDQAYAFTEGFDDTFSLKVGYKPDYVKNNIKFYKLGKQYRERFVDAY